MCYDTREIWGCYARYKGFVCPLWYAWRLVCFQCRLDCAGGRSPPSRSW